MDTVQFVKQLLKSKDDELGQSSCVDRWRYHKRPGKGCGGNPAVLPSSTVSDRRPVLEPMSDQRKGQQFFK